MQSQVPPTLDHHVNEIFSGSTETSVAMLAKLRRRMTTDSPEFTRAEPARADSSSESVSPGCVSRGSATSDPLLPTSKRSEPSIDDSASSIRRSPSRRSVLLLSQRASADELGALRVVPNTRKSARPHVPARPNSEPVTRRGIPKKASQTILIPSRPGSRSSTRPSARSTKSEDGVSAKPLKPGAPLMTIRSSHTDLAMDHSSSSSSWGLAERGQDLFAVPRQASIAALNISTPEEMAREEEAGRNKQPFPMRPTSRDNHLEADGKEQEISSQPAKVTGSAMRKESPRLRPALPKSKTSGSSLGTKQFSQQSTPSDWSSPSQYFPMTRSPCTSPLLGPEKGKQPQFYPPSSPVKRSIGMGSDPIIDRACMEHNMIVQEAQRKEPTLAPAPILSLKKHEVGSDKSRTGSHGEDGSIHSQSAHRSLRRRLGDALRKHSPDRNTPSKETKTGLMEKGKPFKIDLPARTNSFLAAEAQRVTTPPVAPGGFFFDPRTSTYDHRIPSNTVSLAAPQAWPYKPTRSKSKVRTEEEWFFKSDLPGLEDPPSPETDIPEHLPSSPLCPRHPKNKSKGQGRCPLHGSVFGEV